MMIDLKLVAKCGLILLLIASVAILIEQMTWSGGTWDDELDDSDNEVLPIKDPLWPYINNTDDSIYNENFVKCLLEHSRSSYYPVTQGKNVSVSCIPSGRCIHNFLIHTTKVLKSLNLRIILIEPSLLFCMLPSSRKYNLLTRGYISTKYKGSKNVVTVGIESSQAEILDKAQTRKRLASFHFKIIRFEGKRDSTLTGGHTSIDRVSHYFLMRYDMILHIVVLYPRDTFLFSSALHSSEINMKGLQYVKDTAFENFTTSTTYFDASSTSPVLIPFDSRCFLLDMMSSQFIECKNPTNSTMLGKNTQALMALTELKSVLASQMVIFWLWSKSLQGWYETCDVQHYTSELKFSVKARSVQGFNFSALFDNSFCQHIEKYSDATNTINSIQLSCHDIKINLIFMYEDKITYWTEYVDAENIYKLRFPKFSLCSTAIFGEKVNVPCETGEILESEYGQFLKNTTLSLNPESMENVVLLMERK